MDMIGVQANEASTSAATDTPLSVSVLTDTAVNSLTVNHLEKQVVSVKEDGNITVPTSVVTTDSLEDAKASAIKRFQYHHDYIGSSSGRTAKTKSSNTKSG